MGNSCGIASETHVAYRMGTDVGEEPQPIQPSDDLLQDVKELLKRDDGATPNTQTRLRLITDVPCPFAWDHHVTAVGG